MAICIMPCTFRHAHSICEICPKYKCLQTKSQPMGFHFRQTLYICEEDFYLLPRDRHGILFLNVSNSFTFQCLPCKLIIMYAFKYEMFRKFHSLLCLGMWKKKCTNRHHETNEYEFVFLINIYM